MDNYTITLSPLNFCNGYDSFTILQLPYFQTYLSILVNCLVLWGICKRVGKNGKLQDILETMISFLIFGPVLALVLFWWLLILLIRGVVSLYLQLKYKSKVSLLSGSDGFWGYEEYASTSNCAAVYIIKGDCCLHKIRGRMEKVMKSEIAGGRLNQKLVSICGFFCWETIPVEKMNMEDYVKVVKEDKVCEEKDVFQVLQSNQDKPIREKALWGLYVMPQFSYDKTTTAKSKYYAVVLFAHHSIMDGVSMGNLLQTVLADKPFKFFVDPVHPFKNEVNKPPAWKSKILYVLGLLAMPKIGLRCVSSNFTGGKKFYSKEPQLTGPKTFKWTRPINSEALKRIKNETKTSTYSVLLSSFASAVKQMPGEDCNESFNLMCPIALVPYPDRKLRNWFTGVVMPVNVGGDSISCGERLKRVFSSVSRLNTAETAIGSWYYLMLAGYMPTWMHKPLSKSLPLKMALSNVPGAAEDIWIFDGGRIVDVGIWVPIKYSIGIGMGVFSYKDRIRATIVADGAYYQNEGDVQCITKTFEKELTLLGKSIGLPNVFCEH